MRIPSALLFCLLSLIFSGQEQDLNKNFSPLKSKGLLPPVFTQNIREVIKKDISDLEAGKDKDAGLKAGFVTASNYQVERIIRSGNAVVNDEITDYMNKVADVILRDNPALRSKIQIYTLKSPVVNAYSFDKGYVFVNIGLLAQVETEAQLAYILCHEISHYVKQHHINTYVINDRIDRGSYDGNTESRVAEKCQYSKEYESEADLEGFRLFERTPYDLKQAEKGFTMLQYSHLPFELEEVKKSDFETKTYKLPESYFLKEYSSIRDNSDEDDSRMTHPNTRKRRMAIGELVSARNNSNRVNTVVGQKQFEYVRDLARMELCRLYLKNRDYPNAFYASYILSKKYPQNEYVATIMAKSMFGIGLVLNGELRYNNESYLPKGILPYEEIESYPQEVYYLIKKMSPHEWAVFSLNKVYRDHKRFPASADLRDLSDSLFNLLGRTKWTPVDFRRVSKSDSVKIQYKKDTVLSVRSKTDLIASLQGSPISTLDDTVYFRHAFIDLFEGDQEFARKFPSANRSETKITDFYVNGTRLATSGDNEDRTISLDGHQVDTLLLLEPFYYQIDQTAKQSMQYVASDRMQEELLGTLEKMSQKVGIQVVKMDPGVMRPEESATMNDFSVINDWFDERFDSETRNRIIMNTDEIRKVIAKYGTHHILKTGFASIIDYDGKRRTYFMGFLFDLQKNELVFRKYEMFKDKDRSDLVHAKTYQMLYSFKHPKKPKEGT